MKKLFSLAMTAVFLLAGISALAAPLENENLEAAPIEILSHGFENGEVLYREGGKFWTFLEGGTAFYQDGAVIIDSATVGTPFMARIDLGADSDPAEDLQNFTGVAFYVENHCELDVGISFFGEVRDHNDGSVHQLAYENVDFDAITCYLIDAEGNILLPEEYPDMAGWGHVSVPAGFTGWFLVDLANGAFNHCYYSGWGYHSGVVCDGAFHPGQYGLHSVGFNLSADLMDGETVVIRDYALWAPKDGFEMPVREQPTETPTEAPTVQPTVQPTQAPAEPTAEPTAAASPAPTENAAPAGGSFPVWAWIVIGAVVVSAVILAVGLTGAKRKRA